MAWTEYTPDLSKRPEENRRGGFATTELRPLLLDVVREADAQWGNSISITLYVDDITVSTRGKGRQEPRLLANVVWGSQLLWLSLWLSRRGLRWRCARAGLPDARAAVAAAAAAAVVAAAAAAGPGGGGGGGDSKGYGGGGGKDKQGAAASSGE